MNLPRITTSTILLIVLTNSALFGQGWTDDGTVVRLTTSTDKVGIGTTTPTTKLHVVGTVTATGFSTGYAISRFGYNTGLNTTGYGDSFFGVAAGLSNTTGYSNSFFEDYAGYYNTTGYWNSFFGDDAGLSNTTGNSNSFFGAYAGNLNTTGYSNSFFGRSAGYANTTGNSNSFFGDYSGNSNTTGASNSFFGTSAGSSNTSGWSNSFFGQKAGYSNTAGTNNSFFGYTAGYSNTTAGSNSFFGHTAGYSNTTGVSNSFFGYSAGYNNTFGNYNSFLGLYAGINNTTGSCNSFFGISAGQSNTTGNQRTAVGYFANWTSANYSNNTALGYDASCTASDQVRIGNSSVTSIGGYTNWTNISDSRFKRNVQEDVKGLDFIMALRPVSYNLDLHSVENFIADRYGKPPIETLTLSGRYDKESIRYSGFIAQEVATAAKGIGYDFSGVDAPKNQDDFFGLRYAEFVVPLVKAVQEQQETINLLVAALKANGIEVDITMPGKGKFTPKEQGKDHGPEITQSPRNAADPGTLPSNYNVSRNYPNPFNPNTTIEYALPKAGQVTIKVYNSLGQEVRTLVDGFQEAGYKSVVWDGKNHAGSPVASGSYMYRLTAGDYLKSEKMILTK